MRTRAAAGTPPSRRRRLRPCAGRARRAGGRSRFRRPGRGPSRPRSRAGLPAGLPRVPRGGGAAPSAPGRGRGRRERQRERRGSRRPQARDALLDPVEVRDLGIAPLQLVEPALRGGRIVQVVSVNEHQVQQRLPVVPIVPPCSGKPRPDPRGGSGFPEPYDGPFRKTGSRDPSPPGRTRRCRERSGAAGSPDPGQPSAPAPTGFRRSVRPSRRSAAGRGVSRRPRSTRR